MKRKIIILINLFLLIFIVCSCNKKEKISPINKYKSEDTVTLDGLSYTYYSYEDLYINNIPFDNSQEYKPYYNQYYYDMSDLSQKKIEGFSGLLFKNYITAGVASYDKNNLEIFSRDCSPITSPTNAYYFRIVDFFRLERMGGFIVSGYNDSLEGDVEIPKEIDGFKVLGIGFKALENSKICNLKLSGQIIHPYAINKCDNLKTIKGFGTVLSMGIANCKKLKEISDLKLFSDCALYNLERLVYAQSIQDSFSDYLPSGFCSGLRKSKVYNCPNYIEAGNGVSDDYRLVKQEYGKTEIPLYAYNNYRLVLSDSLLLRDDNNKMILSICYDENTKEAYLPFLNNGLNNKGSISIDPNSKLITEEEDGYYIKASYPIELNSNIYGDEIKIKLISK